jgi:RecJ-like exonuclease
VNDSDLLKLSIIVAIIGLLGLFLYGAAGTTAYSVSELDQLIGQKARISGTASSMSTSKAGNTFFMISDGTGQINTVVFKDSGINVSQLKNGVSVEVTGTVQEYQGKLEIIAESIEFWDEAKENK